MTKLLTLAIAITAFALSSSFAQSCGGCSKKDKDAKKTDTTKENASYVVQF